MKSLWEKHEEIFRKEYEQKKLCEKYLREGEELLTKKDFIQASEKFWGSAAQIVKAVATKRGSELRSHGDLHKEVATIAEETKDEEVRLLWQSAISLHQNFYENWLPPEMVEGNANDVKKLVQKLKDLSTGIGTRAHKRHKKPT